MNEQEWEAICDGCAKCCLHKFIEDEACEQPESVAQVEQGEQLHYTNIACHLLDDKSCECTNYAQRTSLVPSCVKLSKDNIHNIGFMPPSCSYRRLHEGRDIPSWHPLRHEGRKQPMYSAQMSAKDKVISERKVDLDDFEDYIVLWPLADLD
jgi:uncharacterized cysteine cluster protein YcgN (CxxCxxCC family)